LINSPDIDPEIFQQHLLVIPRDQDIWLKKHKHASVKELMRDCRESNPEWFQKEEETEAFRLCLSEMTGWEVSLPSITSLASLCRW
jgi:hypothetical protein